MDRKIHCEGCKTYLGVIRDAKLKKGMVYLCKGCEKKRVAADLAMQFGNSDPLSGFMSGMRRS